MKIKQLFQGENRKKILNLIYSVGAAVIFNVVIQLLVYPFLEKEHHLGEERFGVALAILSMLAITAGTCGYAVNSARLLGREKGWTNNGDYNLMLLGMGTVCSIIGMVYLFTLGLASPLSILLFTVLIFVTMLRYYSEVEYRLSTNFFHYMIYYILISVGYLLGLYLFHLTDEWMLTFILGETLALLFVIWRGSIYRAPLFKPSKAFGTILASIGFLFFSSLIDNVTLHADRILLEAISGGEAVTTYYIASLIGKVISMLTLPINAILISYLVRYKGDLTRKIWSVVVVAALGFGALGFGACLLVSPWLIGKLYADNLAEVSPYLAPAILGQVFYFVSGVLMMVLLRFKGEKKQFLFNAAYAVEFFTCVTAGTLMGDLKGFVYAILLANGIRFAGVVLWGFLGNKPKQTEAEPLAEPQT